MKRAPSSHELYTSAWEAFHSNVESVQTEETLREEGWHSLYSLLATRPDCTEYQIANQLQREVKAGRMESQTFRVPLPVGVRSVRFYRPTVQPLAKT
jgi:hypothetical protein